jgi:hypothetical protein
MGRAIKAIKRRAGKSAAVSDDCIGPWAGRENIFRKPPSDTALEVWTTAE